MYKKLFLVSIFSILCLFSITFAKTNSITKYVDKMENKVVKMFSWSEDKQFDYWTKLTEKIEKLSTNQKLTASKRKLYKSIHKEMEARQYDIFERLLGNEEKKQSNQTGKEEKLVENKVENKVGKYELYWVSVCNFDSSKVKVLWNWFYWYSGFVFFEWLSENKSNVKNWTTQLHILETRKPYNLEGYAILPAWDSWGAGINIDSNSFKTIKVYTNGNYKKIKGSEMKVILEKKYWGSFDYPPNACIEKRIDFEDKNAKYSLVVDCDKELYDSSYYSVFVESKKTKEEPNTIFSQDYCN